MQHVLQYGKTVYKVIVLENHANLTAHCTQLFAADTGNIFAVQAYFAVRNINQPVYRAQQCAFAAAAGPYYRYEFTRGNLQVDIMQRMHIIIIVFVYIYKFQNRFHKTFSRPQAKTY